MEAKCLIDAAVQSRELSFEHQLGTSTLYVTAIFDSIGRVKSLNYKTLESESNPTAVRRAFIEVQDELANLAMAYRG